MKLRQVKEVVLMGLDNPLKIPPVFMWGGPGIGKSSIMRQAIAEAGDGTVARIRESPVFGGRCSASAYKSGDVYLVDIRLLHHEVTDFKGIPVPNKDTLRTTWFPPDLFPVTGRGIIFYDELNCAPAMVQNASLELLLDRCTGPVIIPDGFYQCAAGNREMEAFVNKMSPTLLNRFVHVDVEYDINDWIIWAMKNDIYPPIIGMLAKFRPELIYKFDPARKAYPTPRSWEFASNILRNNGGEELKYELVKGCVGEGAATELKQYMNVWSQLPDIDAILDGKPADFPKNIDVRYACCVALIMKAVTPRQINNAIKFVAGLDLEYLMFVVVGLLNKEPRKTFACDEYKKVAKLVVNQEGILP